MTSDLDWNVLVTAREGGARMVRSEVGRFAPLRRTRFRNVAVGRVDDFETFAAAVDVARGHKPFLDQALGRVLPIARTFDVDAPTLAATLTDAAEPFLDRLRDRSFHVRVERRGHKGVIDSSIVEHALAERLCASLTERGEKPVVAFDDPDVVVAVELVGEVGGLAFITRELRPATRSCTSTDGVYRFTSRWFSTAVTPGADQAAFCARSRSAHECTLP
jgi:tRNA(Ser,Leu) C12 N-acetylase TAN1